MRVYPPVKEKVWACLLGVVMPFCLTCGWLQCRCDWHELERSRVFQAELSGYPVRTCNWTCNHAAGRFNLDESKAHPGPMTEKQRRAITNFHTTHTLKRRPDFLGD